MFSSTATRSATSAKTSSVRTPSSTCLLYTSVEYPQWSQHLPAPHKGGAAAAVAIEGAIYLLYEGGTLWRLDPSHADNRWERCCPYEAVRREYAVTAAGGYLFVLGGLDRDGRPSRFVDRYDPRADAWSDMTPPMRVARTRLAAAGNQRGIVVCGGVRRTWFGWRYVTETAEHGGYPLLEHLRKILEGSIIWAPGVNGAVVLSLRGGDFIFECGQDLSVGYESHDGELVRLYIEESFSFHVATPEAAVALKP